MLLTFQVEPIRNFFAALFLASIGMLIHFHFLWNHVDILLAAVVLVIIIKTTVVSVVVKGFGYNNKTSLLVRFWKQLYYNPKLHKHESYLVHCVGWNVSCPNRGVRFRSFESRFESSFGRGKHSIYLLTFERVCINSVLLIGFVPDSLLQFNKLLLHFFFFLSRETL